ncbi:hypothetical protein [Gilliamella intestini]|uniref:Uncharacterized protein n=1 Tax=Gilliamella intestini TaxID=1798183 RepID=A0A1C4CW97_9GAMM|nr:hypothetical protein [Gilliamella intestini]SCC23356.1 hypothetical protein GA0061080_105114 [Gilliamella intestini]
MKFKTMLFILLSLIFIGQNAYADPDEDLDTIPEQFRFPKYNNIAHPPIDVEYKGLKGTVMFITQPIENEKINLGIYFLTNNNKELYKAFEIYSYEYDELLSVFEYEYTENETKYKSILILTKEVLKSSIHYRYFELPILIDNDGVLRVLYFIGDDALVAKIGCIDDFETKERCEFSTKEGLIKYLNKERKQ